MDSFLLALSIRFFSSKALLLQRRELDASQLQQLDLERRERLDRRNSIDPIEGAGVSKKINPSIRFGCGSKSGTCFVGPLRWKQRPKRA